MIEAAGPVVRQIAGRRRQHRPAMLDPRSIGHAHEQFAQPRILDLRLGPVDEETVDVMFGGHAGDGVDEGASFVHPGILRLAPLSPING